MSNFRPILLWFALFFFASACQQQEPPDNILEALILRHGGEKYHQVLIDFEFRGKQYQIEKKSGRFRYERSFRESGRDIRDILANEGFSRWVDDQIVSLTPEDSSRLANSLNSVVYFALLPEPLKDPAVKSKVLQKTSIQGQPYYALEVTFHEKGGGKDFDDEFVYWIHREKMTLDYLAYKFHVNGGGIRFRKATNVRDVGGILFADYVNFKPEDENVRLVDLPVIWREEKLDSLSLIALENINVFTPAVE